MSDVDEQVKNAYGRLEAALAPPLDVAERVARRVSVRRRRRRAGMAGAATVFLVAVTGTAVALSGGDDATGNIAVDRPGGPTSTLVLTRPDGSTYSFDEVTVSCDPPAGEDTTLGPPEGRIWMTSPLRLTGDPEDDDTRVLEPFVYFEGVVAKLQGDRAFELPVDGPGGSASYPLTLFMADPVTDKRSNEVSSSQYGAAGTVRVLQASCDPVPVLELEVDATLGSEVGQGTLAVAGSLR